MKKVKNLVVSVFVIVMLLSNSIFVFAKESDGTCQKTDATLREESIAFDTVDLLESEANYVCNNEEEELEITEEVCGRDNSNDIGRNIAFGESALNFDISEFGIQESAISENDENTNPNNAYIIDDGDVVQGTIVAPNEFRWYAFEINESTKVSIWLQMVENLDADLYVFEYNEATNGLDLINGSATEGAGITEFSTDVLNSGLYFVAISGYESTGNYAFAYIESTADIENELNDTYSNATNISLNTDISGVIDNPYDYDFYRFTVTAPTILRYSINSSDNYVLAYAGSSGSAPTVIDGTLIKMSAGTYTFAVYSPEQSYSASSIYTIRFNKVGEFADESIVPLRAINERAGIVFQTNLAGTICYVNGHLIDISYQYDFSASNSGGSQSYHISLQNMSGVRCQIWNEEIQGPSVDYYYSSTRPAKVVGNKPVLNLMFYTSDTSVHFYNINCTGTGAYRDNTCHLSPSYVIVEIDPDDGKLIDICEPNYFYDYAMGSNYITTSQNYGGHMIFNYNLYDFVN